MSSWTETGDGAEELQADPGPGGSGLFQGDTGRLDVDTRRVLVQLLLGPAMDARRQSKLWPVLLREEALVRSRLHELFLDLVIDRDQQVAFTRQIQCEELDVPILLRKASLTFLETALLLFLRQRLTQADAQLERAVVSPPEMREHLMVFERADNQDRSGFANRVTAAIDKAGKLGLLRALGRGADRYEISPTLKLLFSAEDIQALTRTYAALSTSEAPLRGTENEEDAP